MTTIVTRSGKGSSLSWAEMDANLINLNTDKLEASALTSYATTAAVTAGLAAKINTSEIGVSVQAHSANLDEYAAVNPTAAGLALLDDADAAAQRTTLGLVIGTNVQAYDADIPTVAASQAEMEAGTESALRSMSPLRVKQAIAALAPASYAGPTLGTPQSSTSGSSIDFTSIPAGTKRITVMFDGVSLSGSSVPQIQIGDSGGVETTGYNSFGTLSSITSGFPINNATNSAASTTYFGMATLALMNSSTNTWAYSVAIGINAGGGAPFYAGGTKTLSPGQLDRVRITTVGGSDTFDAGSINIMYE